MKAGILFVLYCACDLLRAGAVAPLPNAPKLLPETAVLDSVDGNVIWADDDTWFFEPVADVNEAGVQVPAGTRLELLPSAALARLIADVNDRHLPLYRLSARATRYRGANYLLPLYYLPLSKLADRSRPPAGGQDREPPAARLSGPEDPELAVPKEILDKLRNRRPLGRPPRQRVGRADRTRPPVAKSRMLVERVGLIQAREDRFVFVPYGLGWDVSDERFELLPSTALEKVAQRQIGLLEPIRFNVAGLVTQFRGRQYLLLQRAVPVYNYGNFVR